MERNKNLQDLVPFRATHPGFVIEEELEYMHVKKKDFAEKIGLSPSHFSELLKGKRPLNPELALRIEQHTELKADVLMKLQAQYSIDVKRVGQQPSAAKESSSTVSIPIPKTTYDRISKAAKSQGTTINAFIRSVLNKAVVLL